MKKSLIVSMFSKQQSSYANHYIDKLNMVKMPYDIIYFERYLEEYEEKENEIVFKKYCPTGGNKIKKIGSMLQYMAFIRKVIKREKYSSVVVLTTVPSIFLIDILLKRYKNKFILDIRDFTYETNKIYYRLLKKVINAAYSVVLSSDAFKTFLPSSNKYVITHNIAKEYEEFERTNISTKDLYIIGFVGSIRYYNENTELINQIEKSDRYTLSYYGTTTMDCNLEEFCKNNKCSNVLFYGKYNNDEKKEIYQKIDIINSIYGIEGLETTTAIPNRFYDAAIYKCPIIVSKGTYLGQIVKKYNIGVEVDVFEDNVVDVLNEYFRNFNQCEFEKGCRLLLEQVNVDMSLYEKTIEDFIDYIKRGH